LIDLFIFIFIYLLIYCLYDCISQFSYSYGVNMLVDSVKRSWSNALSTLQAEQRGSDVSCALPVPGNVSCTF